MVPFQMMVYLQNEDRYVPADEVPQGAKVLDISGTELRQRLNEGRDIPAWFTYPEVVKELRRSYPPRDKQGVTIFFTGLSGSGKSTIANALITKFLETGGRPVTLLDGDLVRKNLSSELGFSKEHRDINIRRIGYVASEITKNGGIAICAPIAPYEATRKAVRQMIEPVRWIHPRARRHFDRCLRTTRPQRPLRQGARRHREGVHRHLRSLRSARPTPKWSSIPPNSAPRKRRRPLFCTSSVKASSAPTATASRS